MIIIDNYYSFRIEINVDYIYVVSKKNHEIYLYAYADVSKPIQKVIITIITIL
jgi:hypothetical protein